MTDRNPRDSGIRDPAADSDGRGTAPDPAGPGEDKEFETRRQGAVYQGAFEAVIAIVVMTLAGYWLDGVFGTEPVLLLVGVGIGFTSFVVRLIRIGRWVQDAQRDGEQKTGGDR